MTKTIFVARNPIDGQLTLRQALDIAQADMCVIFEPGVYRFRHGKRRSQSHQRKTDREAARQAMGANVPVNPDSGPNR